MNTTQSSMLAAASALALAQAAVAAPITWTKAEISGDTDVSTAGDLVYAISGHADGVDITVNGVNFAGVGIPGISPPASNSGTALITAGRGPENIDTNSSYYAFLLRSSYRYSFGNPLGINLTGLTPGERYLVQVWYVDTDGTPARDTMMRLNDGLNNTVDLDDFGSTNNGQFATGTFTADGATQTLTVTMMSDSGVPKAAWGVMLNGLQVRNINPRLYWDRSETAPGAGGENPDGVWDATSEHWNSDSTGGGGGTIGTWTPGRTAAFSAGDDAAGPYTVAVSGTQDIGGLRFENGTVLLSGDDLRLVTDGTINSLPNRAASIGCAITQDETVRSLTFAGSGTVTLSGNNTYSGATIVNGGTLLLDMTGTGALSPSSALNLGGGNFQIRGKTGDARSQTLGALTLGAGSNSAITLDPNGGTSTKLILDSAWSRSVGAGLLIDYSSPSAGSREVVTADATTGIELSNGIYGSILVRDSAGVTGFATRAAGSGQAITRFDDTTGTTLVDDSDDAATNFTTLDSEYDSGTLYWDLDIFDRSVNSLTIDTTNNGGLIDMGGSANILTLTSGGILFKGPNNATLTGGQVGAANSEVIVHQTGTGEFTIGSYLSSGSGSLTKNGVGTLIVTNPGNNYTGNTTVNGGKLVLPRTGTYASATTTVNAGGTLELNSGTATVDNWRVNTILAGNGTINVTGNGWIQTFTNAHTFSGTVNILEGAFGTSFLNSNWTGVTADFHVSPGALLDARGQAITIGSLNGEGTLGTTWTSAATVNVGAGNKSGAFSGSIQGNGSSGTNDLANPNGGVLSLNKIGTGTQVLSGNNTFTGSVAVSGGTLRGSTSNAFGAASGTRTITVSSGATLEFDWSTMEGGHTSTNVPALVINGGTVTNVLANSNQPLNNVRLNGGALTTSVDHSATWRAWSINGTITSTGTSTISGSTINAGILLDSGSLMETDIDVQSGTLTIATPVMNGRDGSDPFAEHATSLTKLGAGTLILSSTGNGYTGATTVYGGTLLINGNTHADSAVTVYGGTLGGGGTVGGSVTVTAAGNLAPGAAVGTLTINGGLDISAMADDAGTLFFELGPIAASDRIAVVGTLTIGNGALGFGDFDFTHVGGLQSGTYTLITSGGITGTLDEADRTGDIDGQPATLKIEGGHLVLEIADFSPFESWAGPGVPFDGDANGDGVSNGLAFLLGAPSKDANALGKLPKPAANAGGLVLNFQTLATAARGTAQLTLEHSNSLAPGAWNSVNVPGAAGVFTVGDVTFTITGTGPLDVTATISAGAAANGRLFGRCSASEN